MSAGKFIVEELRTGGAKVPEGGVRFEWDSDHRSSPIQPWTQAGEQRNVRTDYPGASEPTFQILGPRHAQTTLRGRWDDRYNYSGFAQAQRVAFESLARRGNLVRISFVGEGEGGISLEGLIVSWTFDYRRLWDIGYEFTLDPTARPEEDVTPLRAVPPALSAMNLIDRVIAIDDAMRSVNDRAPTANMAGSVHVDAVSSLDEISNSIGELSASISQRTVLPDVEHRQSLFKLATQFRTLGSQAYAMSQTLVEIRSDYDLISQTALGVLDLEAWSRGLGFNLRLLVGETHDSANDLDERSDPAAIALYRPFKGESLYSVSERFYGTPHAWHDVADRNSLTSFTMTGDELLVIPERPIS